MKLKAKAFICAALSALLFLGSCEKNDDVLKNLEKVDISYIMKTDLTCVNGEELYIKTPFYAPSDILIRYENPVYFDGRRLYFFRYSITEAETNSGRNVRGGSAAPRTAVIACFDTEKNEVELILEEDNKKHISYTFAAFEDSCLYYYRLEQKDGAGSPDDTAALYRIGIEEKKAEKIADVPIINGAVSNLRGAAAGEYLYFGQRQYENDGALYTLYSYNTKSKKYEEFKTGIGSLMEYGNGIAYTTDSGGVYSFNPYSGIETEIYASAEEENIAFYSNGEKIFYKLIAANEENNSAEIGYISDGKKKKIGWDFNSGGGLTLTDGEKMLLINTPYGKSIIYDEKHGCLARISLNRENCQGFPATDSVMFVCYDNEGQNPVFYLYSREKVKTQPPSMASGEKNLLEHP